MRECIAQGTGESLPPAVFHQVQAQRKRAEASRQELVEYCLERGLLKPEQVQPTLYEVGLLSQTVHPIWPRLPASVVPQRDQPHRRAMLNAAKCFFSTGENFYTFVVTSGQRVELHDLRCSIQTLSAKIRKLSERPWFEGMVSVLLRSIEYAWNGSSAHVHMHVVIRLSRRLRSAARADLLVKLRKHFRAHVTRPTPLVDVVKSIPYHFKGEDLTNARPQHVTAIAKQVKGLRLIEPSGEFADFVRELKRNGEKIVIHKGAFRRLKKRAGRLNKTRSHARKPKGGRTPLANYVISIGQPRYLDANSKEPVALVLNFNSVDEMFRRSHVARQIAEQLAQDASGAVPLGNIVPDISTTVRSSQHESVADLPSPEDIAQPGLPPRSSGAHGCPADSLMDRLVEALPEVFDDHYLAQSKAYQEEDSAID